MEGIKASDVRIGNWLRFDNRIGNSYDYQVTPRFFTSSMLNEDFEVNLYHRPIPLSEEWLLKFGFEEHITLDIYPTYVKGIFNVNDNIVYVSGLGFVNHIKHVHQLQNLYFALTGEELTLSK